MAPLNPNYEPKMDENYVQISIDSNMSPIQEDKNLAHEVFSAFLGDDDYLLKVYYLREDFAPTSVYAMPERDMCRMVNGGSSRKLADYIDESKPEEKYHSSSAMKSGVLTHLYNESNDAYHRAGSASARALVWDAHDNYRGVVEVDFPKRKVTLYANQKFCDFSEVLNKKK